VSDALSLLPPPLLQPMSAIAPSKPQQSRARFVLMTSHLPPPIVP
jgi:hypothetical protein